MLLLPSSYPLYFLLLTVSSHLTDAYIVPTLSPRRSTFLSDPFFSLPRLSPFPSFYSGLFHHPFTSPYSHPIHAAFHDPFFSPSFSPLDDYHHHHRSLLSTLSSQLNEMQRRITEAEKKAANPDEKTSFCEYYIEQTPTYRMEDREDGAGVMLIVDLPHVQKEKIDLHFESDGKTLSLSAPFEVIQGFHDDDPSKLTSSIHIEKKPSTQEDDQTEKVIEQEKSVQGLVVVDAEEEEKSAAPPAKGSADSNVTPNTIQVHKETSSIQCKISGLFKTTFHFPQRVTQDHVSAKFENEQLLISLPSLSSTKPQKIYIQ